MSMFHIISHIHLVSYYQLLIVINYSIFYACTHQRYLLHIYNQQMLKKIYEQLQSSDIKSEIEDEGDDYEDSENPLEENLKNF